MSHKPDPEALLVALVLCPGTYSRNRFFELFQDPTFFAVRRRALLLRSIILEVTQGDPARRGHIVTIDEPRDADGRAMITYVVPSMNLKRTTALTDLELSLVRYALAAKSGPFEPLAEGDPIRGRIEDALQKLAPDLTSFAFGPNAGASARGSANDSEVESDFDDADELKLSSLPDTDPER